MAIGRPINLTGNVASKTISVTATANQTEFTVVGGYRINQIDVFRNGVKLTPQTDFQAADASKVVLTTPSNLNDEVSFKIFDTFSVADAIVGAASSQTINGDLVVTGILYSENGGGSGGGSVGAAGTWTNYDNNTGVTTTSKVKIQNDLEVTGVTTSNGFVGSLTGNVSGNVSGTSGGLIGTPNIIVGSVTGTTGSFTGNVTIGGTLTYEDVTNVDSVGVVTARTGIKVLAGGINAVGLVTGTAFAGYDYLQAPFSTTVNFAVTVASKTAAHRYNGTGSGSGYVIDGVQSPFLTLTPGRTYRFTLSSSDMTSHPFRFYLEADKTTAYTTNVTSTATYTEIVVTDTTPTVLHYQCSAHGYMGNAVNTNSNVVSSDFTGTVSDSIGPLRRLGVNTKSSSYTLLVSDAGKLIRSSGSGAAITLNSGIFTAGDMISVFNVSSGNNTVVQGSGVVLYNTANAATGTRTIEPKGMATIVCISGSNEFAISGSQLV